MKLFSLHPPRQARDVNIGAWTAWSTLSFVMKGNVRRRRSLLVTLRERIRLDEIGGLVDQLVLAIRLRLADARLRPEVMVLVDAHIAFRRALELHAGRGGRNLVDVE